MEIAGISVLLPVAIVAITEPRNVAPDSLQKVPGETRCRPAGTLQNRALRDAELGDIIAVKQLCVCLRLLLQMVGSGLGARPSLSGLHQGPGLIKGPCGLSEVGSGSGSLSTALPRGTDPDPPC